MHMPHNFICNHCAFISVSYIWILTCIKKVFFLLKKVSSDSFSHLFAHSSLWSPQCALTMTSVLSMSMGISRMPKIFHGFIHPVLKQCHSHMWKRRQVCSILIFLHSFLISHYLVGLNARSQCNKNQQMLDGIAADCLDENGDVEKKHRCSSEARTAD